MRQQSSLESIQIAWGRILRDFRQWVKPEGAAMWRWKTAPLKHAIMAAKSSMIDDAESMLKAWSEHSNSSTEQGMSAFMPVMTTAIAPIMTPPEYEQVIGHADWLDVVIPTDPLQRHAKLRTMPAAFRCQIAFFCPDVHGAMMVANQFCLYFKHESKRTFGVDFHLGWHDGAPITDTWRFRVLDNSLYPDKAASEYQNLHIVTVDCTIMGDIPIVIGLGDIHDGVTDTIEIGAPKGHAPIVGNNPTKGSTYDDGIPPQSKDDAGALDLTDDVVHTAHIYHQNAKAHTQVHQDDKDTPVSESEHD